MKPRTTDPEFARLKWSCRRGMLELDTLLMPFLEKAYVEMSSAELTAFRSLLQLPDPLLFDYLMGYQDAKEGDLAHIIDKIRSMP